MKKAFTRILSVTLSLIMAFSTVQPALGYYAGGAAADDGLTLTDENGNAAKVSELWDETYPFGAFAFDVTALGMAEGEVCCGGVALGYPDSESGLPARDPLPRKGNPVVYI